MTKNQNKKKEEPVVFDYQDYKLYLKDRIDFCHESLGWGGYKKHLAVVAGMPQAYLSQVLHGKAQIQFDHARAWVDDWEFDEAQETYFFNLLHLARSSRPSARKIWLKKIHAQSMNLRSVEARLSLRGIQEREWEEHYFSNWTLGAIHMLLTIPGLDSTSALSARLNLSNEKIEGALIQLKNMGLVEVDAVKRKWKVLNPEVHLSQERAALSRINQMIWRQKAVEKMENLNPLDLHYSGLHTLSRKDFESIREILRDALLKTRKRVKDSKEETLAVLNLDWFEV